MGSMLSFLEYVLTTREKYKAQKKAAEKIIDKLKVKIKNGTATPEEEEEFKKAQADFALADGKQAQMKVLGNSFFGSFGALVGAMFPWKSAKCAEQTTCTGRQCLRLMISYFSTISERYGLNDSDYNYEPIVGDSVTGDTPLFIRYKDSGLIDIKPLEEIFNSDMAKTDELGRRYDTTEKPYQVLCRSGWSDVEYVYCHETNKQIYRVTDGEMVVDVTEDHSLFDSEKNEIKPKDISKSTKLEYVELNVEDSTALDIKAMNLIAVNIDNIKRLPMGLLNANKKCRETFLSILKYRGFTPDLAKHSKTLIAGIQFLNR
jgi:hypothetical protein